MWIKTPTGKPREWKEGMQKSISSITQNPKKEVAGVLSKDINEMKNSAQEIKIWTWTTFNEAAKLLLKKKAEGENCFISFNWTKIYSVSTKDIDDAYFQYMWMTKVESEEKDRKFREEWRASEREREKREKWYVKKIEDSREGKDIIITKDVVVAGLKFIAEHPDMEQNQLIDELISLGCNFTLEDVKQQFPECGKMSLFSGMEDGDLSCGASVIASVMMTETWRSYVDERFLNFDDDSSIYAFIRKVTGNERYTKEYVDSLVKKEK